jgi:putative oxidoreductase
MARVRVGLTLLRVAVALLLVIHGLARASLGLVDDFGGVLNQWGFPQGHTLAWTITIVEVVGGTALAAGWLVRPLALWFAFQLSAGIYYVHGHAGWFVVGAGRNGAEYSVLLLVCLAVIALGDDAALGLRRSADD